MSGGLHGRADASCVGVLVWPGQLADGRDVADNPAAGIPLERHVRQQFFGGDRFALLRRGGFQKATVLRRQRAPAVQPLPDHAGRDVQKTGGSTLPAQEFNRFFEGGLGAHHPED